MQGARLACVLCCHAGLYLLSLPHTSGAAATWQPIATSCALAVPDVLCYAPLDSSSSSSSEAAMEEEGQESQQLAGLLFVGSKSNSSQVLGWPHSAAQQQQQPQQQLLCPVLQSAFLPSLAGAQAVVAVQDATGKQRHRRGCGCVCSHSALPARQATCL
jgi:hypothetical protein